MEKYHSDDIHSDINFMIDAAYELEGLLLLAKSRGEDVDDEVLELIKEKINALQFSIEGITSTTSEPEEEPATCVETENFEEDDTAEPDFELQYVLEDDEVIDSTEDDEEDAEEEPESEEEEEDVTPVEEYVTEEPIIEESTVIEVQDEVPEEETEDEPVAEPATAEVESEESEYVDDTTDEETDDAPITLDQAYIINKSKDLSTAFSLNDTYRFRRELFGNSAADMTDAINLANAMASYEEAEDYFYEDLGWDKDSEEVQDFMAIIKNNFIV